MINWLKQRGLLIKKEQWEKVEEINAKIAQTIREDHTLLDKLQKPCSVFATFETEEGHSRAARYNEFVK